MTTYIPFTPANISPPFQTNVTLDGSPYSLSALWNLAGQRWYIRLADSNGNIVWNGPMIGSSLTYNIPLAVGVFTTSTILYREDTGNFEITP